jgi:hypothetical protein
MTGAASGVAGLAREEGRVDADLAERALVFGLDASSKSNSGSAAQCSQPFDWISASSCPAAQPA